MNPITSFGAEKMGIYFGKRKARCVGWGGEVGWFRCGRVGRMVKGGGGTRNAALAGVRSPTQQGRDLHNLGNVMVWNGSMEFCGLASNKTTMYFPKKQMIKRQIMHALLLRLLPPMDDGPRSISSSLPLLLSCHPPRALFSLYSSPNSPPF